MAEVAVEGTRFALGDLKRIALDSEGTQYWPETVNF